MVQTAKNTAPHAVQFLRYTYSVESAPATAYHGSVFVWTNAKQFRNHVI